MAWKSILCANTELNLRLLGVGQSFRWKKIDDVIWQGVAHHRVWQLYQDKDRLFFRVLAEFPRAKHLNDVDALKDYFQLNVYLSDLHLEWAKIEDDYFKNVLKKQPGIRLLRQDPVECLFSFICSSNNNIKRISMMVENLCMKFGESVTFCDSNGEETVFYDFPTLERLKENNVEETLRNLSFGYRARYVAETTTKLFDLNDNPANWLLELRAKPYNECCKQLMYFTGVGRKVADCVCLMALDKTEVVPIDTHVLQITAKHYLPELKKLKNVSDKIHITVGNFYRERFGIYAGWAQGVLFANDV